jgi:ketosteroid isomerase-like protein
VAIRFNECINRGDLAGLVELMTEDHAFTDTLGATVAGKAACTEAWRGFFRAVSVYRNTFTEVRGDGDLDGGGVRWQSRTLARVRRLAPTSRLFGIT